MLFCPINMGKLKEILNTLGKQTLFYYSNLLLLNLQKCLIFFTRQEFPLFAKLYTNMIRIWFSYVIHSYTQYGLCVSEPGNLEIIRPQ